MAETASAQDYDGFVSYSHSAVTHLAPALQQAVQRFATPWYRLRSVRLFRDDSALGADPALWASIETALQVSSWFVLLASPAAAGSTWVRREVDWWLEHRSLDRVLVVLVDGHIVWNVGADRIDAERTDALPPALLNALTTEPRWVDLSFVRDQQQLDRHEPRFVSGVADIAATLRDQPKDMLIGEDVRQHRRARALARTAVTTLSVLLAIAVILGLVALSRTHEVTRQRDTALSGQFAAQADLVRDRDPQAALRLGVAALRTLPAGSADTPRNTEAVEGNLLETLSGRYRGSIPGRGKPLTASAWSPDGRTVAVGDAGGQLVLQALGGLGTPPSQIPVSPAGIDSLAFSPDGRQIVVGSSDGGISLVDLQGGLRVVDAVHSGNGQVIATFDAQGDVVAAGGGQVLRWRPDGPPTRFPLAEPASPRLALTPSGTTLAVADFMSGVVTFWDLTPPAGPSPAASVPSAETQLLSLSMSADGRTMISSGKGGVLVRWDLTDLRHPLPAAPTQVEGRTIVSAAISPDASTIAYGSIDNSTVLIDARTGQRRDVLRQLATPPLTTAFSPDSTSLSSGALDGTSVIWDARPTPVQATTLPSPAPVFVSATGPDGRTFATGSRDGTVALYDVMAGVPRLVSSFNGGGVVDGLAFDPRGTTLAVATGSTVTPWAIGGGAPVPRRSGAVLGRGGVETIAFADDGGTIVAGGQLSGLWRWSWSTPDSSAQLVDGQSVFALAVSPDGHSLVTSSPKTNTLEIWDVRSGAHVRSLPNGHATSAVDAMTFAGPTSVVTGGRDGAVVLTDIGPAADRQEVGRLQALTVAIGDDVRRGYVFAVAVSRDQRLLAVGGSDGTTSLWDLSAPERPRSLGLRLTSDTGNLTALTFADDDRLLISATFAGPAEAVSTGFLPDLRNHALNTACERAGGPLSEKDWRGLGGDSPYQDTCAPR